MQVFVCSFNSLQDFYRYKKSCLYTVYFVFPNVFHSYAQETVTPKIIRKIAHDSKAFTQGFIVDEGIFIDPVDLKNLKILETNENIDLSNNNFLIINYWASWCLECIEEHPYLIELSKTKGFENSVFMLSFKTVERMLSNL